MKLVSFHPNLEYKIHDVKKDELLSTLQTLVGGHIESISPKKKVKGFHFAYVNEEAELKSLTPNYYASRFLEMLGYNLFAFIAATPRGVVVLMGSDANGSEKSLSKETLDYVESLHPLILKEDEEDSEEAEFSEKIGEQQERDASPERK